MSGRRQKEFAFRRGSFRYFQSNLSVLARWHVGDQRCSRVKRLSEDGRFLGVEVKRRRGRVPRFEGAFKKRHIWSMKRGRRRPAGTRIAAVDHARTTERDVSRQGRHLMGGRGTLDTKQFGVDLATLIDDDHVGIGQLDIELQCAHRRPRGKHARSITPRCRECHKRLEVKRVVTMSVADEDRVEPSGPRTLEIRGEGTETAIQQNCGPRRFQQVTRAGVL